MADEEGGGGEDFSDVANSIIDSFSELQSSIQDHAEQMSELQDNTGDTVFDSDFMGEIEESLRVLSENSSVHINKQEELIGSIENLEKKMEELGKKIESTEVSSGGGGGVPVNYNKFESSVSEGVSDALKDSEINIGDGGPVASMTGRVAGWLEVLNGKMEGDGLSGEDLMDVIEGEPGMSTVQETLKKALDQAAGEGGIKDPRSQGEALSQALSSGGGLKNAIPDIFEDLDLEKMSSFIEKVEVSVSEVEDLEKALKDIGKKGEFGGVISVQDLIEGEIEEGSEAYDKVVNQMYDNLKNVLTDEGADFISYMRNLVSTTEKQLQDLPAGVSSKIFGLEPYFEEMEGFAEGIEQKFLEDVLPSIEEASPVGDVLSSEEMKETLFGAFTDLVSRFNEMDEGDMSIEELRTELSSLTSEIIDDNSDVIEGYEDMEGILQKTLGGLSEQLAKSEEIRRRAEAVREAYEQQLADVKSLVEIYENLGEIWENYKETWNKILTSPRAAAIFGVSGILAGVSALASYFLQIDQTLNEVAEDTGLVASDLSEMRSEAMEVHGEIIAMGGSFKQVVEALGTIRSELGGVQVVAGRFNQESSQFAKTITSTAQAFGVGNQKAVTFLETMQSVSGTTGETLEKAGSYVQRLATVNEVAPQQVMSDIAGASEEIAKFGAVGEENIAKAATQARKMGSNLGDVLQVAEKFRQDITGSVQGLQRAELMLGQGIDTQGLVEASFKGPQQFTEALRGELKGLNMDLENLPTYRLQSLADATGMSVGQLRNMAESAKLASLSMKDLAGKSIEEFNKGLKNSQTNWASLMSALNGLWTMFKNLFAEAVFDMVTPALKQIRKATQGVVESMEGMNEVGILGFLDKVQGNISDTTSEFEGANAKTASFATTFVEGIKKIIKIGKKSWPVIKSIGRFLYGLGETVGSIMGALDIFADWIAWANPMLDKGEATVSSYAIAIGTLGTALVGLKVAISKLGASTSIMKSAGVQLAAIAGSLYIASEAVKNFAGLSWDELKRGMWGFAGAAFVMVGALYGIGKVVSSQALQMAAAAGMMITFAGSMWVLGDAMQKFADAGWEGAMIMGAVATGLVLLGGAIAGIMTATAGLGAGAAFAAAGLLGALAGSMWILGDAMQKFASSTHSILDAVNRIKKLEDISSIVPKIKKLTNALSNMPTAGVGDFLAGLVGEGVGDQLGMIVDLAHSAQPLQLVAASMERIAASVERIASAEVGGKLQQIEDATSTSLGEGVGGAVQQVGSAVSSWITGDGGENVNATGGGGQVSTPTINAGAGTGGQNTGTSAETGGTGGGGGESAVDILRDIRNTESALLTAMRNGGIAVYMDGEEVTDKVVKSSNRKNQTG